MKINSLTTKKKTLRVETFYSKPVNIDLDVIKEVDNKILIKTFNGSKELTLKEGLDYWIVTKEFPSDCIPIEWENFIICLD